MAIIKKLLKQSRSQRQLDRDAELYRNLIRREAKIGGEIFGPVAPGGRREFFCLDEHTWIWHEEWMDASRIRRVKTTRYDVRPSGILKAQDGQTYHKVHAAEAQRLLEAIRIYEQRVRSELYAAYV